MPNPELSQYKDHDTNTVYDLKDAAGRATLATVQADIRKSIISISTMANGQDADYTDWLFMSALNNGYFVGQDQAFVRIHFNSSLVSYSKPVRFIYYFDETHGQGVYICNVVTNYFTMENLGGHYKQGDVLDFIFFKLTNTFVLVGPSDSVDLSNYYTKTQTDTLLNAKVSDNPTFTEAATRQNIASGETFAVILGKIKKFFTDLKTVAFTGSYNDLTDKPSIPSGQVQSDWSQSDTTAVDFIKNKPTIPSALSDLSDDSTHRVVTDTEKSTWSGKVSDNPTFTEASTRANIASGESFATILGKIKKFFTDLKTVAFTGSYSDLSNTPNLANVATSGDYTDLSNKPTIPTVNDSTISFWYNQDSTQSFTLNQNSNKTINLNDHITTLVQGSNVQIVGASESFNSMQYTISAIDTKPSNFGTQTSAQEATVSIGSDTNWHRIRQILGMTAGKLYLVEVSLMYPSATGGFRSIGISTSATNSSGYPDPTTSMGGNFFENVAPASGAVTNITLTTFFTPASGETYYLCGRQNNSGGSSLAVTPRYRIVQLN